MATHDREQTQPVQTVQTVQPGGTGQSGRTGLPTPRALMFDLDGTLYRGNTMVPGADELISELRDRGVPCWFVTNNSSRTPGEVAEHLRELGIPAEADRVVTSSLAAADYAAKHYAGRAAYVIGETGLREALKGAGLELLPEDGSGPAAVVIQGIDRDFGYGKLATAVRHLLNGAAYLLTNPDTLLPADGGLWPGAGSLAASIRTASGQEPVVIGKPSSILMDYALGRAGVAAVDAWVIGDNPHTDIAAAVGAGCPSVLTLTGLCSETDWDARCDAAGVRPDAVCADLHELREMLRAAQRGIQEG